MNELRNALDPRKEATFTLGNRLKRLSWSIAYSCLFRISPRPFHAWRAGILKLFGADMGKGTHVYPNVRIWAPWNLIVEDEAGIADDVILYSMAKITIGKRAVISQGAHLCTGTHDYQDPSFRLYAEPISVGAEAWICADAFIGPGVSIGEAAVIGARSVVSKDMPASMVCAGNPCRPLKAREMRQ